MPSAHVCAIPIYPFEGANGFMARPNMVPGVNRNQPQCSLVNYRPQQGQLYQSGGFPGSRLPTLLATLQELLEDYVGLLISTKDFSIIKGTNVNERVSIEFRADFLNIFNRVGFRLGDGWRPVWFCPLQ